MLAWFAFFPRRWRLGLVYGGVAAGTYALVRYSVGARENIYTVAWLLEHNTTPFRLQESLVSIALIAVLMLTCLRGWRHADKLLRRLVLIIVPVYLVLFFVFGDWREIRLLMSPLILLMPLLRLTD